MDNVISFIKYKQNSCEHTSIEFIPQPKKIIKCYFCRKEFSSFGAIRLLVKQHDLSKSEKKHLNDLLFDAIYKALEKFENVKM